MKIIVAGGGKIGDSLVRQLAKEGHDLTLIDQDPQVLRTTVERVDAMGVEGNCASKAVLLQAGVEDADLLIAVTKADEVNLLCCMTAHGINKKIHTIARIRNPEYSEQVMTMRDVFPRSMTVNPDRRAAMEMERLLKYPGFLRRDTFAKGRVEIVELRIDGESRLKDVALIDLPNVVKCRVLVCAVLRDGKAMVSNRGDFVLREGDRIFVTAPTATLAQLLHNLGIVTRRVRKVMLCGGGRVAYYLASLLEKDRITVEMLDRDLERCQELAEKLTRTSVSCGDCSSQEILDSHGIADCDAVVSVTGVDETNMIVSLYAAKLGVSQVITKISRGVNASLADSLSLGSVICPKDLCCNNIVRYVRAMGNQTGAALSVHAIADGQAEAVEFRVENGASYCNVPLKRLKFRPDVLIGSITRGAKSELPGGDSVFMPGDLVVVVTSGRGVLQQFRDIFD